MRSGWELGKENVERMFAVSFILKRNSSYESVRLTGSNMIEMQFSLTRNVIFSL